MIKCDLSRNNLSRSGLSSDRGVIDISSISVSPAKMLSKTVDPSFFCNKTVQRENELAQLTLPNTSISRGFIGEWIIGQGDSFFYKNNFIRTS